MENRLHEQFSCNYKSIIIDEIALEGLEGIGIDLLWRRVEKRIFSPVTEKMKARFWNFILNCPEITIYQLPEPVPYVEILDRFEIVNENSGHLSEHTDYLDGPYEYNPIENEHGSSIYYHTRKLIFKEDLNLQPYEKIIAKYGDTIVLVASIEARWYALAPHIPITYLTQISTVHYCILELIGRGRQNGQTTFGNANLLKIVKDSKLLFYNRVYLQKLDFIRSLNITFSIQGKGSKCLLLRLKRFHQPLALSIPKKGKIHDIYNYLLQQPDFSQRTDILVKKGLLNPTLMKKLQKTLNIFKFVEKAIIPEGPLNKKNSKNKKTEVLRKFISISPESDESSQSDEEETTKEPLKCRYKVGVNLMRQAYERFLDAGMKGYTQHEIGQTLGVEFYTARVICKILKMKNIVREFLEDKGKQRIARYIAVSATQEMDILYAEEKKKFLEYLVDSKIYDMKRSASVSEFPVSGVEVPIKRQKVEECDAIASDEPVDDKKSLEPSVTEVKVLDGLQNSTVGSFFCAKKTPTLRQLRFANGMLKVIREKQAISGYQPLNRLVSIETNEPPMDLKALKLFVQKLVFDGQIKLLKMKCPGPELKFIVLICAPYVKSTDPVIKAKYMQLCTQFINNKNTRKIKIAEICSTNLINFSSAYPRYLKIQKLHEIIMKMVYFSDRESSAPDQTDGFCSLSQVIHELTVEFAIGNISNVAALEISKVNITKDMLHEKLGNVPTEVFKVFWYFTNLQQCIKTNLRALAMLGLVQLVTTHNSSNVFYVNKHAQLIDTTGMWPRSNVDKETLKKIYTFNTFSEVEDFWNDVYNISTKTTIQLSTRNRKPFTPPIREQNEIHLYADGQCVGDGLGPCGFDSSFFMEIPRLWCTFYSKMRKLQQQPKQKTTNLKVLRTTVKLPTKTTKKLKIHKKKPIPKSETILKTAVAAKPELKKPLIHRRDKSKAPKWTNEEDDIIMICKAAITIMSPVSQAGCLVLRNAVAKEILSLRDPKKTRVACHRRAKLLETDSNLRYEKDCLLNELRRRANLIHQYEGLLKKLRLQYPGNFTKLMAEAQLPMLELVWLMFRIIKSKSFKRKVPCVATDFQDFQKNFTIISASANESYSLYRSSSENEPCITTLKEGVIVAVASSFQIELTHDVSQQIYSMFKSQLDQNIGTAVEHLRKSGAISAKDKIFNNQKEWKSFDEVVQTAYKISANYQRKWINRLNSEFVEDISESLEAEHSVTDIKGSPDINCIFFELQTCNTVEIVMITCPVISGSMNSFLQEEQLTVHEIETKYKLKSGTVGWKNKSNVKPLSVLYNDVDYDHILLSVPRTVVEIDSIDDLNLKDPVLAHLDNKKEAGSTLLKLLNVTNYDVKTLTKELNELEKKNIITQVGYYENLVVLTKYSKPWTMNMNGENVILTPWLSFDRRIRHDIFLKWAGAIMNKVFENQGCSIAYLSNAYEYLTTKSTQDICMFLEKYKCVKLNVLKTPEVDLFSDDEPSLELDSFNKYESVHNILVFPVMNALSKYAWLRKKFLDNVADEDRFC